VRDSINMTIKTYLTRLILFCVLPLILLALILSGVHSFSIQSRINNKAKDQVHNVVTAIDRDLQARILALQFLAESPHLEDISQLDGIYLEAQNFRKRFSGHVVLADLSTKMLFNTRLPLGSELPFLPVPEGFAAAPAVMESGEPAVGDMFFGPIGNQTMVAVVVPVLRHGSIQGLLLSLVNTSQYQNVLDDMKIPGEYSIKLYDSARSIIAQRPPNDIQQNKEHRTNDKRFDAKSKLSNWIGELEVSSTAYYQPTLVDLFVLLMAIIFAALVSIIGGRRVGLRLAHSVASLTEESPLPTPRQNIFEIEKVRSRLLAATEAKRSSEEELRKSEALYRSLFEGSNVAKSMTLPTGEIRANKAFCDLLGYRQDEMRNKTWQALTPPEEIESILIRLAPIFAGEKDGTRFTKRYIHKDDSTIWADVSVAVQRDPDGQPHHFITTIVDITELKKAEAELIESERRYRSLFENMTAGFELFEVVQDDDGVPIDLVILAANKFFDITTGLNIQSVTGKRLTHVLPGIEKDAADWIGTFGKVALTGEPHQFEQRSELLGHHYSIMAYQAGPKLCAVTFIDITDHVKSEEEREKLLAQLHQAQKMEAVGKLAGGVAHDYNNMLSVIIGNAELGLKNSAPDAPIRNNLDQILAAALRSSDITRQLLAFARKQTIAPKVLDLNKAVKTTLKFLKQLLGEHIDLTWHPKPDIWPVKIDPTQLDQILTNLCVNARDSIADVGKMTVETDCVSLDQAYCRDHPGFIPGNFVVLTVSDDGCGMDRETIHHIFEPFYTTKKEGEGTGLGLATVFGIVKQNNGFINVYSEPEKGTTFRIYLPQHEGGINIKGTVFKDAVARGQGEMVLVVEDEPSILQMTSRLLQDLGYQVLTADSPAKALAHAKTHGTELRLLLTDVVMPKINGRDLAQQLKQISPHLKCLYMSGYTANVIAHHGVLEDGIQFLHKPFSTFDLSIKVREALASEEAD